MPDKLRRFARTFLSLRVGVLTGGVCLAGPISVDALRNASYPSGFAPNGVIRLQSGQFHDRFDRRGEIRVEMTDHVAIGALPDGTGAAAVILRTTTGGNAAFHDLTLMVDDDEAVRWQATAPLGDRVQIDGVRIEDDEVILEMRVHTATDPMCCPSSRLEIRYVIRGSRLVARTSE